MYQTTSGSSRRTLLVVAGPGRSGTSLFTGLVSRLGVYVPRPEVVANKSNPRGFSEPRWAVDFHKELLASLDVTIEDARPAAWEKTSSVVSRAPVRERLEEWLSQQFANSDRIVVKDPRLAWFLSLYRVVAESVEADLRVVTMLRHPTESMKSREIAYGSGISSTSRLMGWLNLMQSVEGRTRDLPRTIIRYDDLLTDWQTTFRAAESSLGMPLVSSADDTELKDAADLVDVSLRRSTSDWDAHDLSDELRDLGQRTYDVMAAGAASPHGGSLDIAVMDDMRAQYVAIYRRSVAIARSTILAARADERRKLAQRDRLQPVEMSTRPRSHGQVDVRSIARRVGGAARSLAVRVKHRLHAGRAGR